VGANGEAVNEKAKKRNWDPIAAVKPKKQLQEQGSPCGERETRKGNRGCQLIGNERVKRLGGKIDFEKGDDHHHGGSYPGPTTSNKNNAGSKHHQQRGKISLNKGTGIN